MKLDDISLERRLRHFARKLRRCRKLCMHHCVMIPCYISHSKERGSSMFVNFDLDDRVVHQLYQRVLGEVLPTICWLLEVYCSCLQA